MQTAKPVGADLIEALTTASAFTIAKRISSAANARGLYCNEIGTRLKSASQIVFRGEYPRPNWSGEILELYQVGTGIVSGASAPDLIKATWCS